MDFDLADHGSVYMLTALTDIARDHAAAAYADALTFGGAIAIEHGYAPYNAEALLMDGFRVSLDGRELELRAN